MVPTDVTDERAVERGVEETVEMYGRVTGLVNNAGMGLSSRYDERREVSDVSVDDWRTILDVNTTGAFICATYAVPELRAAGRGNVVNISSGLGRRGAAG